MDCIRNQDHETLQTSTEHENIGKHKLIRNLSIMEPKHCIYAIQGGGRHTKDKHSLSISLVNVYIYSESLETKECVFQTLNPPPPLSLMHPKRQDVHHIKVKYNRPFLSSGGLSSLNTTNSLH